MYFYTAFDIQYQLKSIEQSMPETDNASYNAYRRYSEINYQKITIQTRKKLIELVVEKNLSVYRAAKDLHINNSTAKAILRKYRATGHIFVRKAEKPSPQNTIENQNDIQSDHQEEENRTRPSGGLPLCPEASVPLMNPFWVYWCPQTPYIQTPQCYLIPFS